MSLTFDKVMTVGKTLDPEAEAPIAETFSCDAADAYATQKFGLVASGCPRRGQHHVAHEGLFVELLDDEGQEVVPGEAGRVVVTSFYN